MKQKKRIMDNLKGQKNEEKAFRFKYNNSKLHTIISLVPRPLEEAKSGLGTRLIVVWRILLLYYRWNAQFLFSCPFRLSIICFAKEVIIFMHEERPGNEAN